MTAQDVIVDARRRLRDQHGQRWDDATLVGYLTAGLARTRQLRPVLWLTTAGAMTPMATVTALSSELGIDSGYLRALSHYVVAAALTGEDDDPANAKRAAETYQAFMDELGARR